MKATALLRDQHGRIDRLLDRIGKDRQLRIELVLELVEELLTHISIEGSYFLGRIADESGIPVGAYREEHADLRNAMLQAVFVEADDEAFGERLRELGAALRRHTRLVERDLFPLVESHVRPEELERMGERMQAFWNATVGGARPSAADHSHAAE
jgi:Hemerythrin HHE cation binding domain